VGPADLPTGRHAETQAGMDGQPHPTDKGNSAFLTCGLSVLLLLPSMIFWSVDSLVPGVLCTGEDPTVERQNVQAET